MVLPLLPIFSLISEIPALFDAGKKVVETITGETSTAATPDELQSVVQSLPPDKQEMFVREMEAKVEQYKAENDRLRNEQGDITDDLIKKVGEKAATKIALLRMATRPIVVRRLVHYMMVPLYLLFLDGTLAFINIWIRFIHAVRGLEGEAAQLDFLAATFFSGDSVYATMYAAGVTPAAGVVITYMTLRQIGKAGNKNPIEAAGNSIRKIIGAFSK